MLNPLSMSQCCSMDYMKGYNAAVEKANARVAELEEENALLKMQHEADAAAIGQMARKALKS